MTRVLAIGIVVLLLLVVAVYAIRRENARQEAELRTLLATTCPMIWANPDKVHALPAEQLEIARKYCPET